MKNIEQFPPNYKPKNEHYLTRPRWRPGELIPKDYKVDARAALQRNARAAELAEVRVLRFKTRLRPITDPDGGERRAA